MGVLIGERLSEDHSSDECLSSFSKLRKEASCA